MTDWTARASNRVASTRNANGVEPEGYGALSPAPALVLDFKWTDERVERLKTLVADGLSAGKIAIELEVTRNTIIGKARRLGLQLHGAKTPSGAPRKRKIYPRSPHQPNTRTHQRPFVLDTARFLKDMADPAFDVAAELPPALPPVTAVFFHELEPHHCRYPYGHTPDMLFCGAIAEIGSYCAGHHAVTHGRSERKQQFVDHPWKDKGIAA